VLAKNGESDTTLIWQAIIFLGEFLNPLEKFVGNIVLSRHCISKTTVSLENYLCH
jgi:hypothetical protein